MDVVFTKTAARRYDARVERDGVVLSVQTFDCPARLPHMLSHVNTVAGKWAEDRAAESVGMRRRSDGSRITYPDAKYAIDDVTRDHVRAIVTEAFEDGSTIDELAERIRNADTFGPDRAERIAVTEAASLHAGQPTRLAGSRTGPQSECGHERRS